MGIPVQRISAERVLNTDMQMAHFDGMKYEELKEVYKGLHFPDEQVVRDNMLKVIKACLIWEVLPLSELQRDCLDAELPIASEHGFRTDAEKHRELSERLRIDLRVKMHKTLYESKGVPIDRIGTLKSHKLAVEYDKL